MKITIPLRKDSDDIKGEMIAAHNRSKEIIKNFPNAEISLVVLREYIPSFLQKIRKAPNVKKTDNLEYDGLVYKTLWFNFSIVDNILVKLKRPPLFLKRRLDKFVSYIENTDLIIAHSLYAGYVAMRAKEKYKIPYTVTWHGSDIHTNPLINPYLRSLTIKIIKNADANHFVSNDLKNKSDKICITSNKSVLYNGVNKDLFRKYTVEEKTYYFDLYKIPTKVKNIVFIGNLIQIKNVLSLPSIFKLVQDTFPIHCHFLGDGSLKDELETQCLENGIKYSFWGNQPSAKIPSIINCMDIVVLPSYNEGLPLVTLESLACGVPVVGSRVGGIPEAIGDENTVIIDKNFNSNMAKLIIKILLENKTVKISDHFSWRQTGLKEKELIKSILTGVFEAK